jgi:hypothetical protein
MHIKTGNSNTNSSAYTLLVHPILDYEAACWKPYREGQVNALDQVQNKGAEFAHHRNDSTWETLAQCRESSYVISSEQTRRNGLGTLLVIDYKGYAIWAGKS